MEEEILSFYYFTLLLISLGTFILFFLGKAIKFWAHSWKLCRRGQMEVKTKESLLKVYKDNIDKISVSRNRLIHVVLILLGVKYNLKKLELVLTKLT